MAAERIGTWLIAIGRALLLVIYNTIVTAGGRTAGPAAPDVTTPGAMSRHPRASGAPGLPGAPPSQDNGTGSELSSRSRERRRGRRRDRRRLRHQRAR